MALMFELTMSLRREKTPMDRTPGTFGGRSGQHGGGDEARREEQPAFGRPAPEIGPEAATRPARVGGERGLVPPGPAIGEIVGRIVVAHGCLTEIRSFLIRRPRASLTSPPESQGTRQVPATERRKGQRFRKERIADIWSSPP